MGDVKASNPKMTDGVFNLWHLQLCELRYYIALHCTVKTNTLTYIKSLFHHLFILRIPSSCSHSLPATAAITMASSLALPSIVFQKHSFMNGSTVSFTKMGSPRFARSGVFMRLSVRSQTLVDDALFADYKPTSAFLFPGQVMSYCHSQLDCFFF